jgi:hypothetical protein
MVGKYIDSMVEIFAYILMFAHRPQSCESLDRAWDSIAGYRYSYIIGKGVLVGYKRYYIIYSCK